jgi:diguanylate cyclase
MSFAGTLTDMRHPSVPAIPKGIKLPHSAHAHRDGIANLLHAKVRQARAVLRQYRDRFTAHREAPQDTRRRIEMFARRNARLAKKLVRLKREVTRARHFAYHDQLTGLPNRGLLMDRLTQAMAQAARQHKQVGLLLLDLDQFKSINDRFGHAAGDQVLQEVARRLSACIRSCDTACRYGGDEFVIMLPEIDGWANAEVVAHKIRAHLAAPYVLDDQSVILTASIGIAVYRADERDGHELIREADSAMYLAKARRDFPARSH